MIIRHMSSKDIKLLKELQINMHLEEPTLHPVFDEVAFDEKFSKYKIEDFPLNKIFLCIEDGKIIGRLDCIVEQSFIDFERVAYIDWVFVLKSHRNKGIAKKLFEKAESFFKKEDACLYYLFVAETDEARGFYKSINIDIKAIDRASKLLK